MNGFYTAATVNTAGHTAGVLIFAIFLYLVWRGRATAPKRDWLPLAAAGLALLWNLASLTALLVPGGTAERYLAAIGFSLLSLLPCVLLELSLKGRFPWLIRLGYGLSASAVGLHAAELFGDAENFHRYALWVITAGFGALTVIGVGSTLLSDDPANRPATSRLLGTMSLFLFAISFAHFGEGHLEQAWAEELAFHHAGIPLALFVLMQEYRFVLVDALIRFLANGLLAALFGIAIAVQAPRLPIAWRAVGVALAVALFAWTRDAVQHLLTRVVFRRPSHDRMNQVLESLRRYSGDEAAYLKHAAEAMAALIGAPVVDAHADGHLAGELIFPTRVEDLAVRLAAPRSAARVVVPIRLSLGETRVLLLGERRGGRPYLSEDLEALARLALAAAEQLERLRATETGKLVAQAELRALQAQIHPHFLFNALNTLYGIIPREAQAARKTVLDLAGIFRYFLRSDKTFVPLQEEMDIVRAYLAVEAHRLGPRLKLEIVVDETLLREPIPVLSIEPLVENAIKHGVAAQVEGGTVRIEIARLGQATHEPGTMRISVFDSGPGFAASQSKGGAGVGLANVNRRLQLCYGTGSEIEVACDGHGTQVSFRAPCAGRGAATYAGARGK